jgi:succinylglutamate desuccinylase
MPNRNLERVLDPQFTSGMNEWSMERLRAARHDVQTLEDAISMLRRLVQGRLDILGSELQARTGQHADRSLIESLVQSLSDHGRPASGGRLVPTEPGQLQLAWATARADAAMHGIEVGDVDELSDETLHQVADSLHALEKEVSAERRKLHEQLDVLQGEIVRRYKSGEATVEGLLR